MSFGTHFGISAFRMHSESSITSGFADLRVQSSVLSDYEGVVTLARAFRVPFSNRDEVGGNRMKKRLSKRDWARVIGLISVLLILLKVAQR